MFPTKFTRETGSLVLYILSRMLSPSLKAQTILDRVLEEASGRAFDLIWTIYMRRV